MAIRQARFAGRFVVTTPLLLNTSMRTLRFRENGLKRQHFRDGRVLRRRFCSAMDASVTQTSLPESHKIGDFNTAADRQRPGRHYVNRKHNWKDTTLPAGDVPET